MSQFGAEKFTTRSRAAIEAAQLAATTAGNTAHRADPPARRAAPGRRRHRAHPGHQGRRRRRRTLTAQAEAVQAALPRASGTTVQQPGASAALTRVLASALDLAGSMKDDYVASEHLLIALAGGREPGPEGADSTPASPRPGCARA